jgi:hypothetical protein
VGFFRKDRTAFEKSLARVPSQAKKPPLHVCVRAGAIEIVDVVRTNVDVFNNERRNTLGVPATISFVIFTSSARFVKT